MTALAQDAAVQPATAQAQAEPVSTCDGVGVGDGALGVGNALPTRAKPGHGGRDHFLEHQTLVVNLTSGAENRLLHANRQRFQGAILGLMWLEYLSVVVF